MDGFLRFYQPEFFFDNGCLLAYLADVDVTCLYAPCCQYTFLLPKPGVEKADFGTIAHDFRYLQLVDVPILGHIEKMIFGELQAVTLHPVNLIQQILVHRIAGAAVLLLQAFYLDVLETVGFRLVVTESLLSHAAPLSFAVVHDVWRQRAISIRLHRYLSFPYRIKR